MGRHKIHYFFFFPIVLELIDQFFPDMEDESKDAILEEWTALQVATDLPQFAEDHELDEWWITVLAFKTPSGRAKYANLFFRSW